MKCNLKFCQLIVKKHLNKHQVRRFIALGVYPVTIMARSLLKACESWKSLLRPATAKNPLKSQRRRSRASFWYFRSGHQSHFCTSARRREAKCCGRRGQSPKTEAGLSGALEWQLDAVGRHIWACWRREC